MPKEIIIGVLGGLGPDATVDLFKKILRNTSAKTDQEHLRIIIDCNPKIPDRTRAILGGGESPGEALKETAKNLERAGAGLIIIPCNTAHYWIEDVRKTVKIKVIDMLDETAQEIASKYPRIKRVGLLASKGTVGAGLLPKEARTLRNQDGSAQRLGPELRYGRYLLRQIREPYSERKGNPDQLSIDSGRCRTDNRRMHRDSTSA